jgi:hypothetical protein
LLSDIYVHPLIGLHEKCLNEKCRINSISVKANVWVRLISDRTHHFYVVEGWTKNIGWKEIVWER